MAESFKFSRETSTSLKPFLNIDGLIHRLKCSDNLPLTFSATERSEARLVLKTRNYYSLSIYKKQLPYDNQHNSFTFSDLMQLAHFDEFLRQAIGPFTYRIEEMMKTTIVTSACVNYKGPYQKGECYLDEKLYLKTLKSITKYLKVLKKLSKKIKLPLLSNTISTRNKGVSLYGSWQKK